MSTAQSDRTTAERPETTRTAFRTCPLCEATCGLRIELGRDTPDGPERVLRVRGDRDDVFSKGFICPKGSTLRQLHEDPDRLRRPLVRRNGVLEPVSWDVAWAEVDRLLTGVIDRHGHSSLAVYVGNPTAHSLSAMVFSRLLLTGLGTHQRYSASTVDQMPRHVAAGYVFGSPVAIPVPDLDRTDHLIVMGANPYASNGSVCTAPDFPGRLQAIRARGGKVVVIDPRRSKTAEEADEWVPIRPGTDALLLAAMAGTMFDEGLAAIGPHVAPHVDGVEELRHAIAEFTPEAVASATGIAATEIRRLAREMAAASSASVYGRIGTTTTEFGSTTSWLIDVVNTVSGNLDRPGGAMFPMPVAGGATTRGRPGSGRGFTTGRGTSRVKGYPEVMGELPVGALVDEIRTPGEGQVRALITVGGNPVLSNPGEPQLRAALDELEATISIDLYLNETTRHADVVLPVPSQLQRSHYDVLLYQFAVRNVANYSAPVLPLDVDQPDEWEIIAKVAMIAQGAGAAADPTQADDLAIDGVLRAAVNDEHSNVAGRDVAELRSELDATGRRGPERMLDAMLRTGPFGDGFGGDPDGTSLDDLLAHPHGRDFGALEPRLPEILRTPSGKVELAPAPLLADLDRLRRTLDTPVVTSGAGADDGGAARPFRLVGRRHLRSNNSWMHNIEVLVKGRPRCTLQVHPDDADRLGVVDGAAARITSAVGAVVAPVEVTEGIMPGVVSLPHGWGHDDPHTQLGVAREHAGVNSNVLADRDAMDPLSGTAVLNGIEVQVSPV